MAAYVTFRRKMSGAVSFLSQTCLAAAVLPHYNLTITQRRFTLMHHRMAKALVMVDHSD